MKQRNLLILFSLIVTNCSCHQGNGRAGMEKKSSVEKLGVMENQYLTSTSRESSVYRLGDKEKQDVSKKNTTLIADSIDPNAETEGSGNRTGKCKSDK